MRRNDFTYTYSRIGYEVFYKGQRVYMVGVSREDRDRARRCPSNLKLNKESAEREMNRILNGYASPDTMKLIKKIDEATV